MKRGLWNKSKFKRVPSLTSLSLSLSLSIYIYIYNMSPSKGNMWGKCHRLEDPFLYIHYLIASLFFFSLNTKQLWLKVYLFSTETLNLSYTNFKEYQERSFHKDIILSSDGFLPFILLKCMSSLLFGLQDIMLNFFHRICLVEPHWG